MEGVDRKNILIMAVTEQFLESSSSSSDDNFPEEKRKIPKIRNYISDVVHHYLDEDFKKHFRVERVTADYLINGFARSQFYWKEIAHGGTKKTSAETHILTFIWFASNKCCLRDVAERFGIGITTCFRIILRIMDYLLFIAPTVIKLPRTEEEKRLMAYEFQKISGFPGIIGCIDGTSINIRTPANKIKSTYVNRHDTPSVTLQAICDYKRKFLDCFTGTPGKIHDSRVFKMSFISNEIANICGQDYHLLGDSAYHLREYLLVPFKDYGRLTEEQQNFNYKLSASRVRIENAFGLLKSRFRQLSCLDFQEVDKINKFIISCSVLHNLCIDFNDLVEIDNFADEHQEDANDVGERELVLRRLGEIKRDNLCRLLNNQ